MTEQEIAAQENCLELIMQDVVRIDFVPVAGTTTAIPFSVANISTMQAPSPMAASLLTLGLAWDYLDGQTQRQADAIIAEAPSHKVSESREAAGIIRTHSLQVPILQGFQTIRSKESALQNAEFYVILTTLSGVRYMAYTLPNTSQFAIDDQMGESATMTVKVTLRSLSGLIRLS